MIFDRRNGEASEGAKSFKSIELRTAEAYLGDKQEYVSDPKEYREWSANRISGSVTFQ